MSNSDPGHPWQPDVLGEPWQARTIDLRPDAGGTPVATLVRHLVPSRRRGEATPAVLYLHGFNDYFFQADHAAAWVARGYDFYAVDLRDHGRSIRPGRRPGQVPGLAVHTEELHAALRIIHATRPGPVVLLGHSTGGLIGALYADRNPRPVSALVLNSPWLDQHRPPAVRAIARPLINMIARLAPLAPVSHLGEAYGASLHASTGGEFDYDLAWKPLTAPVRAGWLASVLAAQRLVHRGLDITAPVLVCTSDASTHPTRPTTAELTRADAVLGVADMHRWAPSLGPHVQVHVVPGGRHDLALSPEPVRSIYTMAVLDWVGEQVRHRVRSAS